MTTKELQAQLDELRDDKANWHRHEFEKSNESYKMGFDSLAPLVIELALALEEIRDIVTCAIEDEDITELDSFTPQPANEALQKLEAYLNGGGK